MTQKLEMDRLFGDATAVAAIVPASQVFSLLSRTLDLPPAWTALVSEASGSHRMYSPGAVIQKDNAEEILFGRVTPVDLNWREDGLMSNDKYQCTAVVHLRVSLIPERGELVSFRNNLLGSRSTGDVATLVQYLRRHARSALAGVAGERTADALIDSTGGDEWTEAFHAALQPPCFAAGLSLLEWSVQFESSTLQQVRVAEEQAVRRRAEHQAQRQLEQAIETAQAEHLDHLEQLLSRLKTAADASPEVDLPDLMWTFSERDRGKLYEALFATEPAEATTRWIVAAASDALFYFDPRSPDRPIRTIEISGPIGGVRSVQCARTADGKTRLLVGAARGVYELDVEGSEPETAFRMDTSIEPRGGANAAAIAGDTVWASHSELGLFYWNRSDPGRAEIVHESMTRGARAVRNVTFCDGDIYASVDERVIRLPAGDPSSEPAVYRGSRSVITSLAASTNGVYAGNADGEVLYWPHGRPDAPDVLHAGNRRPAESVRLLDDGGVPRLFFADTSLAVYARVVGDTFTCRYEAGGQTIRRVEVAPDVLVGTNDARDRLLCWLPARPARVAALVPFASLTRHSVQDTCLVPMGT